MKNSQNLNEKTAKKKKRKLYIDLLSGNKINQPEEFCGNKIKTTRYTL